jgi:glycosyltransferase involved in cell wall biosynthesis
MPVRKDLPRRFYGSIFPSSYPPIFKSSNTLVSSDRSFAMKPAVFLNVTIPVYNEEHTLAASIHKISAFLKSNCSHPYEIVIAENGSTDNTFRVAKQLEHDLPNVRALHIEGRGRGRAIKAAWRQSSADILSYMDVDLSSDLLAFPALIDALAPEANRREFSREDKSSNHAIPSPGGEGWVRADLSSAKRTSLPTGGYDLAIGSRLLDPALTRRGLKRETISRGYNLLVRAVFRTRFSDAQCGFKAITRRAASALLPLIEDAAWFMDTELLVLAEKLGYRIFDLPVRWTDDPDSRVQLWSTALADIKGLIRLRRNLASGRYSSREPASAVSERGVHAA